MGDEEALLEAVEKSLSAAVSRLATEAWHVPRGPRDFFIGKVQNDFEAEATKAGLSAASAKAVAEKLAGQVARLAGAMDMSGQSRESLDYPNRW